jgi:D-sedoheptulose 7-phosphate isomerase
MDYYQLIAGNVQDTMEALSLAVDELAPTLEQASEYMAQTLLADGKIIVCASENDAPLADLFAATVIGASTEQRPALPVLAISCNSEQAGPSLSRRVRALGQEGDLLLLITSAAAQTEAGAAVDAARERNMPVILLSNSSQPVLPHSGSPADLVLPVAASSRARVVEIHTVVLNCLAELIDFTLFGSLTRD